MVSRIRTQDDDPIAFRPTPDLGPDQDTQRGRGGAEQHPGPPWSHAVTRVLLADDHPVVRRGLKQAECE